VAPEAPFRPLGGRPLPLNEFEPLGAAGEAELLALALVNDAGAVRVIMQRYNRRLYRIARSVVKDDSEAEDVVQAGYGLAFTHLHSFRRKSSLGAWLARIVLNEALGRLRRRRATVEWTSFESQCSNPSHLIQIPSAANQPDPERLTAQREIQRLLEQAIDSLPERFRIVLVTRTIEGMSVDETAELLGLRPETVKTRLHRARTLLRAKLELETGPALTETFLFGGQRCASLTARVLEQLGKSERGSGALGGDDTGRGKAPLRH
jgi:RNA polymerase sigma-70 factor, ECF subfamily